MQKMQIIIAEVLLCKIFNLWFQKHFIMVPLFKKRKSHKFSNFSYPGSRKVLISAKIMIPGQNKEMVQGGPMDPSPPTYLTSKKPNACRVNYITNCSIIIIFWYYLLAPAANFWKNTYLERYMLVPLEEHYFYQIHTLIIDLCLLLFNLKMSITISNWGFILKQKRLYIC